MVCSVASMVRDDLTTTPGLSAHPCNNICDEANTKHTHTSACTARSMQTRPETADGAQGCQDLVCKVFSGQMEHCHCAGSCIHECTLRLVCPAAPMPCCPSACPARCANLTNGGHGRLIDVTPANQSRQLSGSMCFVLASDSAAM